MHFTSICKCKLGKVCILDTILYYFFHILYITIFIYNYDVNSQGDSRTDLKKKHFGFQLSKDTTLVKWH